MTNKPLVLLFDYETELCRLSDPLKTYLPVSEPNHPTIDGPTNYHTHQTCKHQKTWTRPLSNWVSRPMMMVSDTSTNIKKINLSKQAPRFSSLYRQTPVLLAVSWLLEFFSLERRELPKSLPREI